MTDFTNVTDILHSWHRPEIRPRLVAALGALRKHLNGDNNDDAAAAQQQQEQHHQQMSPSSSTFFDSMTTIMSSPQIAHDPAMVREITVTLLSFLGEDDDDDGGDAHHISKKSTKMSFHTRHICSIAKTIHNVRRMSSSSSSSTTKTAAQLQEENNNNDEDATISSSSSSATPLSHLLFKLLALMLDRPNIQVVAAASNNLPSTSVVDILPQETTASVVAALLDEDFVQAMAFSDDDHAAAAAVVTKRNTTMMTRRYFSLLQRFVVPDHGKKAFIKFGGAALLPTKFLNVTSKQQEFLLARSSSSSIVIDCATKAASVLHTATASLDVCTEVCRLGGVVCVVNLLNQMLAMTPQPHQQQDKQAQKQQLCLWWSCSLHCLGIIQNLLREISCAKSFWKSERNIETLVKLVVDPKVDEAVKSSAMLILVANAANCEMQMSRRENQKQVQQSTTRADDDSGIKKSLSRCLGAAMLSTTVESLCLSEE